MGEGGGTATRETREGWPLLTVETEVNGDSKSTNKRGPSLVGSLDSSCRYNRFLSCLGCPSQPSANYYFPYRTLFKFISPQATQQPGQSGVLGRLSLCIRQQHATVYTHYRNVAHL
jgi:hypothetical protein